jgi:hypothetical protein
MLGRFNQPTEASEAWMIGWESDKRLRAISKSGVATISGQRSAMLKRLQG